MEKTKENYNISVNNFVNIYNRLTNVFKNTDVVVICGRAANLYSFRDSRESNNINVIAEAKEINMEKIKTNLDENNFALKKIDEKNITLIDKKNHKLEIEIIVHYSGHINEISLNHIIKYSNDISIKTKDNNIVKLASIPGLIALKSTGKTKDNIDIYHLIHNYYNKDMNEFFSDEKTIQEYSELNKDIILKIKESVTNSIKEFGDTEYINATKIMEENLEKEIKYMYRKYTK